MVAKPIRALEFHYPIFQVLIMYVINRLIARVNV